MPCSLSAMSMQQLQRIMFRFGSLLDVSRYGCLTPSHFSLQCSQNSDVNGSGIMCFIIFGAPFYFSFNAIDNLCSALISPTFAAHVGFWIAFSSPLCMNGNSQFPIKILIPSCVISSLFFISVIAFLTSSILHCIPTYLTYSIFL